MATVLMKLAMCVLVFNSVTIDTPEASWPMVADTVPVELPAGVPPAPSEPDHGAHAPGENPYPLINCEEFDCSTVDCSGMALYIEGLESDKAELEADIAVKQTEVDTAAGYYAASVEAYEGCVESGHPNCSSQQIAMERDARLLAEINAEMAAMQADLAYLDFLIDWYAQVGACCCDG